jgi:hypothetical protein
MLNSIHVQCFITKAIEPTAKKILCTESKDNIEAPNNKMGASDRKSCSSDMPEKYPFYCRGLPYAL